MQIAVRGGAVCGMRKKRVRGEGYEEKGPAAHSGQMISDSRFPISDLKKWAISGKAQGAGQKKG